MPRAMCHREWRAGFKRSRGSGASPQRRQEGRTLGVQGWGQGSERRPSLSHSTSMRLFYLPQKGNKSLIAGSWSTAPRGGAPPPRPWHLLVSGR